MEIQLKSIKRFHLMGVKKKSHFLSFFIEAYQQQSVFPDSLLRRHLKHQVIECCVGERERTTNKFFVIPTPSSSSSNDTHCFFHAYCRFLFSSLTRAFFLLI